MKAEAEIEVMPRNAFAQSRQKLGGDKEVFFPKIKQKQGTANISVSDF